MSNNGRVRITYLASIPLIPGFLCMMFYVVTFWHQICYPLTWNLSSIGNHSPLDEMIAVSLLILFIVFICLCSGFSIICCSNCAVSFFFGSLVSVCSSPQSSLTLSIIQKFSNPILFQCPSLVKIVFGYETYLIVVRGLNISKESSSWLTERITLDANYELLRCHPKLSLCCFLQLLFSTDLPQSLRFGGHIKNLTGETFFPSENEMWPQDQRDTKHEWIKPSGSGCHRFQRSNSILPPIPKTHRTGPFSST